MVIAQSRRSMRADAYTRDTLDRDKKAGDYAAGCVLIFLRAIKPSAARAGALSRIRAAAMIHAAAGTRSSASSARLRSTPPA